MVVLGFEQNQELIQRCINLVLLILQSCDLEVEVVHIQLDLMDGVSLGWRVQLGVLA